METFEKEHWTIGEAIAGGSWWELVRAGESW